MVLLPATDLPSAEEAARRLGEAVEDLAVPHGTQPVVRTRLTVSIGVALLDPRTGQTPADVLERADLALYRAKSEGRNRVAT